MLADLKAFLGRSPEQIRIRNLAQCLRSSLQRGVNFVTMFEGRYLQSKYQSICAEVSQEILFSKTIS